MPVCFMTLSSYLSWMVVVWVRYWITSWKIGNCGYSSFSYLFTKIRLSRNLDDGTHIIHPHRYAQLEDSNISKSDQGKLFVAAHPSFRVIAIAAPIPPYPGYPLDPPFRSRFQARFIDPVRALLSFDAQTQRADTLPPLYSKLCDLMLTVQYASESRHALEVVSKTSIPPFPQTPFPSDRPNEATCTHPTIPCLQSHIFSTRSTTSYSSPHLGLFYLPSLGYPWTSGWASWTGRTGEPLDNFKWWMHWSTGVPYQ